MSLKLPYLQSALAFCIGCHMQRIDIQCACVCYVASIFKLCALNAGRLSKRISNYPALPYSHVSHYVLSPNVVSPEVVGLLKIWSNIHFKCVSLQCVYKRSKVCSKICHLRNTTQQCSSYLVRMCLTVSQAWWRSFYPGRHVQSLSSSTFYWAEYYNDETEQGRNSDQLYQLVAACISTFHCVCACDIDFGHANGTTLVRRTGVLSCFLPHCFMPNAELPVGMCAHWARSACHLCLRTMQERNIEVLAVSESGG